MTKRIAPVFLLSHPFSGANIVRSGLSQTPNFVDVGDINQYENSVQSVEQSGSEPREFRIVTCGYDMFQSSEFSDWILDNQLPVIHLIRENTLDCLVSELANQKKQLTLNTEAVIHRISQMRNETSEIRARLLAANSIEIQYENLRTSTGRFSDALMRRIYGWLGLPVANVDSLISFPIREPNWQTIEEIKLKYRPDLTRSGLGNLYYLPRAA